MPMKPLVPTLLPSSKSLDSETLFIYWNYFSGTTTARPFCPYLVRQFHLKREALLKAL